MSHLLTRAAIKFIQARALLRVNGELLIIKPEKNRYKKLGCTVTQLTTIILGRRKSLFTEEKEGNRISNKLNWFVHIQHTPALSAHLWPMHKTEKLPHCPSCFSPPLWDAESRSVCSWVIPECTFRGATGESLRACLFSAVNRILSCTAKEALRTFN